METDGIMAIISHYLFEECGPSFYNLYEIPSTARFGNFWIILCASYLIESRSIRRLNRMGESIPFMAY
jgi:hypothetical protein